MPQLFFFCLDCGGGTVLKQLSLILNHFLWFSCSVKFEPGVLEACLNLLHVSPQHKKNPRRDYANRSNPVYLSRVVSAMVSADQLWE